MGLAGVILAAGESTRMGRDKALLPWPPQQPATAGDEQIGPNALVGSSPATTHGAVGRVGAPAPTRSSLDSRTLLSHNIAALDSVCDLVIVVAGKNESTLRPIVDGSGGFLVRNPQPDLGQFSSLRIGLHEVLNQGRDSAMVTLADRPAPHSTTLRSLVDAFNRRSRGIWSVVPEFNFKHGHPMLCGREMIEEFLRAPAATNAREVEHANHQHILYLPVEDALVTTNINTPEDYASLQSGFSH